MTSLITGFALSMQPVSAETITTDTNGLDAGEVKVPVADGSIPAYRAMPAQGGPFPTVLVVQEIFGVHEHIKDICRRLAKAGYYAIAPELYARQGNPAEISDIQELIQKIVVEGPDRSGDVRPRRDGRLCQSLGQGGYGEARGHRLLLGRLATWMYAAHNPDLKAAVAWYGSDRKPSELTPKNPLDIAADVKCPVLALYGGADQSIPQETIEKRQAACKAAGKTCEFKVYPDAPHGFNADYRPSYRADAAKDGWARMLAWFKDHGVA